MFQRFIPEAFYLALKMLHEVRLAIGRERKIGSTLGSASAS